MIRQQVSENERAAKCSGSRARTSAPALGTRDAPSRRSPRNSPAERRDQNAAGRWPRRPRNRAQRVLVAWKRRRKTRTAWNRPSTTCSPTYGEHAARFGFRAWMSPPAVARLTLGQRKADAVATVMGWWSFIIVQSAILFVWIIANLVEAMRGWDPYPFILLNLALSIRAAYAAPVIMMSQNRRQDIDRKAAENDSPDQREGGARDRVAGSEDRPTARARSPEANGGRQSADRAAGPVAAGCTRARRGRRTAVITHGYRLHGVTSFPIRRAKYHASRYVVSGNLSPPL
jgi:hypothetical protein